jgi:thiol-disulfide isomerase/thioredoxin
MLKSKWKYLLFIFFIIFLSVVLLIKIGYVKFGIAKFDKSENKIIINGNIHSALKHFSNELNTEIDSTKLIFFSSWSSWCAPCIKEIPILNSIESYCKKSNNTIFISDCSDLTSSELTSLKDKLGVKLSFRDTEFKSGLRISLIHEMYNRKLINDTVDFVPFNMIYNPINDSVLFIQGSMKIQDTTELYRIIRSF